MVNFEVKDILSRIIKTISDISNNPNVKNHYGQNLEIAIIDNLENNFFSWQSFNLINGNKILLANLKLDKKRSKKSSRVR
jgi:hypothetical protein